MCKSSILVDQLYKSNPNQNTIAVKKLWPRPEKGCDEKDVKSKWDGQGLCRNAVDHIKIFYNDDPGTSMFCGLGHPYQIFNVINSIPA